MTRQQLLILVGTALVLLINFITRLLKSRVGRETPQRPESGVSEMPRPARRPPPVVAPRRLPPVVAPRRLPAVPDTIQLPRAVRQVAPRPHGRKPLGGLRAVRHGIVLMTILGPCRALEPLDPQA
jgi:hypothetical protein